MEKDRYVTSEAYKALVGDLREKAETGDMRANQILSAFALLIEGWRYGDPDPTDDDDPDGGESNVIQLYERVLLRRAA